MSYFVHSLPETFNQILLSSVAITLNIHICIFYIIICTLEFLCSVVCAVALVSELLVYTEEVEEDSDEQEKGTEKVDES